MMKKKQDQLVREDLCIYIVCMYTLYKYMEILWWNLLCVINDNINDGFFP